MERAEKTTDGFQISREELLKLWEKVKEEETEGLSGIELFYAGIIQRHGAMFVKEVDGVQNPETHEYEPNQGVNPFLHILLHGLVESQVIDKTPIEVIQFVNAMKKQGLDEHAIQHQLCAIFFPLILEGRNQGKETDMGKYAALLKKLKTKKPEKMEAALSKAFHQTAP